MAQMATVPVFKCRACGRPVYVTHLSTTGADPKAELLKDLMQGLSKVALCKYCQMKRNYYATQGREEEFLANELNPRPVILTVVDPTELDYYGRKE